MSKEAIKLQTEVINATAKLDRLGFTISCTYIPGAGWVSRNVTSGVIKKIVGQGTSAAITGAAQDVGANLMGSEQNMKGIPVVDDAKLGLNFAFGAAGEKITQLLSRFTGINKSVDIVKSQIPSRVNFF